MRPVRNGGRCAALRHSEAFAPSWRSQIKPRSAASLVWRGVESVFQGCRGGPILDGQFVGQPRGGCARSGHSAVVTWASPTSGCIQLAVSRSGAKNPGNLHGPCQVAFGSCKNCGLTLRSSGEPTACHQARSVVLSIFHSPGLASHRWLPLSSNVRPREMHGTPASGPRASAVVPTTQAPCHSPSSLQLPC